MFRTNMIQSHKVCTHFSHRFSGWSLKIMQEKVFWGIQKACIYMNQKHMWNFPMLIFFIYFEKPPILLRHDWDKKGRELRSWLAGCNRSREGNQKSLEISGRNLGAQTWILWLQQIDRNLPQIMESLIDWKWENKGVICYSFY